MTVLLAAIHSHADSVLALRIFFSLCLGIAALIGALGRGPGRLGN
jgi:hypothetical protein